MFLAKQFVHLFVATKCSLWQQMTHVRLLRKLTHEILRQVVLTAQLDRQVATDSILDFVVSIVHSDLV